MPTITKSFTAVGTSPALLITQPNALGAYTISGTFVGTIALEYTNNGGLSWSPVVTKTTTYTSPNVVLDPGTYRFRCTAYTSGTAVVELVETEPALQTFTNQEGAVVLEITEDGISTPQATVTTLVGDGETVVSAGHSFQVVGPDLNLDAAAGSSDGSDPKFLAAVMGNVISDAMTTDANYLAGVIGAFSVTGTKATTYPAGGVLGQISDGVTDADGAVVAYVDGDSAVTKANAAFKAMCNNSNVGSGFNYGLDLTSASHDGFVALAILKADIRGTNNVCTMNGAGAPVDGTTGDNFAGPGSLYIDTTGANAYIQTGLITNPVWKLITRAA